jgi:hypothetical protein
MILQSALEGEVTEYPERGYLRKVFPGERQRNGSKPRAVKISGCDSWSLYCKDGKVGSESLF